MRIFRHIVVALAGCLLTLGVAAVVTPNRTGVPSGNPYAPVGPGMTAHRRSATRAGAAKRSSGETPATAGRPG